MHGKVFKKLKEIWENASMPVEFILTVVLGLSGVVTILGAFAAYLRIEMYLLECLYNMLN